MIMLKPQRPGGIAMIGAGVPLCEDYLKFRTRIQPTPVEPSIQLGSLALTQLFDGSLNRFVEAARL